MKKSFTAVATEIINEHSPFEENVESVVKRLLRQFTKFVEMTGGSIDELKNEQGRMLFDEEDVPLLKIILSQFIQRSGFAYDFLQKKIDLASIDDTHDLIQNMLDLMADDGLSDCEAQAIVDWLDRVFQFSFRVEMEHCHRLVDGVAVNLLLYPYTHRMIYLNGFRHVLQQAFAETVVHAMMGIGELAEVLQIAKESAETTNPSDLYGDDPVGAEYQQRDANVVQFLSDNPEIRHYVERRTGATIEEIWGITKGDFDEKKPNP